MTETEKLRQQIKGLKKQVAQVKKTNEIFRKKAFVAAIKAHREVAGNVQEERSDHSSFDKDTGGAGHVKSTFLDDISHEIRSSMNGVVGMTNLVLETDLTEEQREYLEMVKSSADRLLGVVNQVLDYSKIESGKLELETEIFELKQILDNDLYQLRLAAQRKNLELFCRIAPNVPAYIHGDPERLNQVVSNLVNNAIKFTTEGSVTLEIENVGYDNDNNLQLRFKITDTGCGIEEKKQAYINRYFKQIPGAQKSYPLVLGATGLGLTVVAQLVAIMGGRVGFKSGSSGSTFWFTIPVQEISDHQIVEEEGGKVLENIEKINTYALRGIKVLLVEDEYINRILVQTILQQFDVDVTSVESGERAVEEVCRRGYDVLLLDIQLGGMDGWETTRKIRKFEKKSGGHLPVIALTARAMPGDREKCLQAGMDDYLSKPVGRKQLVDMLNKYLTSRALVVVSDVERQQIIVRTLVESGWQVTIADTKRTAMYEVSLSQFDLIVFDMDAPELKSVEGVKIIRQLEGYSGQRAKILGVGTQTNGEHCLEYGVDSYIYGLLTQDKIKEQLTRTDA